MGKFSRGEIDNVRAKTDTMKTIYVAIMVVKGSSKSAIYGLVDLFQVANRILTEMQSPLTLKFESVVYDFEHDCTLDERDSGAVPSVVIVPPILEGQAFLSSQIEFCRRLADWYGKGVLISSVCAGSFLLAQAGLLNGRRATTHSRLESIFRERYPEVDLDTSSVICDDLDLVTASGVMAWLDLGLHFISRFATPSVTQAIRRFLLVDMPYWNKSCSRTFRPMQNHGDKRVLEVQHFIHREYKSHILLGKLALVARMTERTLVRRFQKATGMRPLEYLQQQRICKAQEMLENNLTTIEKVSWEVGYNDVSAFRRIFRRLTGLTPSQHRSHFAITME